MKEDPSEPPVWRHVETRLLGSLEVYEQRQSNAFPAAKRGKKYRGTWQSYMTYRSWPDLALQLREVLKVPGLGPTYDTGKVIPEWLSRSMGGRAGLLGCLWLEVVEESS